MSWQHPTNDGIALHARSWSDRPASEAKAQVILVHGLGEHSGRHEFATQRLASAGYAVVTYDQRGHGRSEGRRGDTPSYEQLLDDLDGLVAYVREDPDRSAPLFLYGHSMGGGLVLNYAMRRQPDLAGLIVTSPLLATAEPPPAWLAWIVMRIAAVWATMPLSARIDPTDLAHDPQVAADYLADALTLRQLSARLAVEILTAARWARENASALSVPTLLMHGDADRITSFDASRDFAAAADDHVEFIGWPDMRHELQWESCRNEVLDRVLEWLNAQAAVTRS